jgi:catechol-2,3-dioxygenase
MAPLRESSEIILEARRKSMTDSMCRSHRANHMERITMIESISAITLATRNMPDAVRFYRMLGFEIIHDGDNAAFTSFRVGAGYLNLTAQPSERR